MEANLKEFSIRDIELFREDDDIDFAIAEIAFIADGDNGQNSPITTEALKRDAKTVLGKPVVAKYHEHLRDVGTHELDEVIVGWVPRDSEVKFKKKDNRTFAVCEAVISKLYATKVFTLFKDSNYRSVSSEFTANQPNPNQYGEGLIDGFEIRAITILGQSVAPAIKDANIQIKKFSEIEANTFYNEHTSNPLKEFSERRKAEMEPKKKPNLDIPEDSSGGKEDEKEMAKLKNPEEVIMEEEVKTDPKEFSDEKKEEDKGAGQGKEKEFEDKDDIEEEADKDLEKDEKAKEFEDKDDIEEKADEDLEKDEHEEEKKMSLDVYADEGAILSMLETETEENKKLSEDDKKMFRDLLASKNMNVIMEKTYSLMQEVNELRAFKFSVEAKECEMEFAQCMSKVKGNIGEKEYEKFYAEGEQIKEKSKMAEFSLKVKAFAYEHFISSPEVLAQNDGTFRFAGRQVTVKQEEDSGDVFARILNK